MRMPRPTFLSSVTAPARLPLWLAAAGFFLILVAAPKPWNPETLSRCYVNLVSPGRVPLLFRDLFALFFWSAAAINLAATLVLLATRRWWAYPDDMARISLGGGVLEKVGVRRALCVSAAVSVALAGWMASPRLSHSFWGDEAFTMVEHLHGHFKRDPEIQVGEDKMLPYFRQLRWDDAVWGYRSTNNHFLLTILAKTTHSAWQKLSGASPWQFREDVIRLLPLVAGLLALVAWMAFFYRSGFAVPAVLLGPFLAIHPWFLRYISEARGYAFVFLLLPLNLLAVKKGLEEGRWRWWLLHALTQFLLLYSWPGMVWQVIGINIGVVGMIVVTRAPGSQRRVLFARWGVATLWALMLAIQLMAPCVPQVLSFVDDQWHRVLIGGSWLRDVAGLLFLGTNWVNADAADMANPLFVTVGSLARLHPVLLPAGMVLLVFLALRGAVCWVRAGAWGKFLLLVFPVPAAVFYACAVARGIYLFPWYFVYLVPVLLALVLTGACNLLALCRPLFQAAGDPRLRTSLGSIVIAALFCLYFTLTSPKRDVLRRHSLEPLRESVEITRRHADAGDPAHRGVLTAHVHTPALIYDPHGFGVGTALGGSDAEPGLTRLMRWADQLALPLFVNVGYPGDAREEVPELMRLIDNPEMFTKISSVWGLEPQLNREIYRYNGGVFDFAAR